MFAKLKDNRKIYYDVYGSSEKLTAQDIKYKPTIVFIHGGPGFIDHTLYVSYWSRFQDICQLVFIDLCGHGRSSYGDQYQWNLRQWAEDVYEFCKVTGIERPIIAGVSLGGWIAIQYGILYPNEARQIILCNTEAKVNVEWRKNAYIQIGKLRGKQQLGVEAAKVVENLAIQGDSEQSLKDYKEKCLPLFSDNPYSPSELARCQIHPQAKKAELTPWKVFNEREYYKFNFLEDLYRINTPTLILAGDLDPEHPWQSAEEMAAKMQPDKVNLNIIPGAGDTVYRDKPEETERIIRSFINTPNLILIQATIFKCKL